jgi:tetratricopeptide (TPR) repeat protein
MNEERYEEAEAAFAEAMQSGDTRMRQESETQVRKARARSALSRAQGILIAGHAEQADALLDSLLASPALDTVSTPELRTEHEFAVRLKANASFRRWSDAGVACARAGKMDQARAAFQHALEQAPDDQARDYARRMLQQLGTPGAPPAHKTSTPR